MNIDADLALMLKDLGVLVTDGVRTTYGLLDSADEEMRAAGGPAPAIGRTIVLTIATGSLPANVETRITAAGIQYTVREKLAIEDGKLTRIFCAKV